MKNGWLRDEGLTFKSFLIIRANCQRVLVAPLKIADRDLVVDIPHQPTAPQAYKAGSK